MINLLAFLEEFTFDTLIALISCIAAIVALFLGGKAYNQYKSFYLKEKKTLKGESSDHSQIAEQITNNYGLDSTATTALLNFTRDSFKDCMDRLYDSFEQQRNENMQKIIELSNQIIQNKKLDIASYSKIDWINVYFESAKNSSDDFMQNIWAKVLAKELSCPNSFSYKALDILKNMSSEDFILFQKLCSMQVGGYILRDELTKKHGLNWIEHLRLRDFSLLNLEFTNKILRLEARERTSIVYQDKNILLISNESDVEQTILFAIYPLSSFALELKEVAEITYFEDYIVDFSRYVKKESGKANCNVTLHQITNINGTVVTYDEKDTIGE